MGRICLSNFSCFFFSSWIFRLYIWPHVDFQIFGEKASNEPVKYIISLVFYISNAWMASRSCVFFRSSIHDAFVSVFRWLFLQYREIETSPIVGRDLPARFEPELFQENVLLLQVFLPLGNQITEPSFELSELFSCDLFRISSKNRDLPCVLGCCSIAILQPFLYLCSLILCGFIMKD